MRLTDDRLHLLDQLLPHPEVDQRFGGGSLVENSDDHLFPTLKSLGGNAEVDLSTFHFRTEAPVLGLSPLGDVHRRENFEDVDQRITGTAIERFGRIHHTVDAKPYGRFAFFGLQMDIGRSSQNRIVNQLASRDVTTGALDLSR